MGKGKGKKKGPSKKELEEAANKKRQEEEQAAEEEDDTEFQKAILEIRVKELEQLKVGMQRKCEFLETQSELYKTQLEEMKEEKDDIIAHLNRCYSEAKTTVKELEDRLFGTQKAREDEEKDFLNRLSAKDKERKSFAEAMDKKIQELEAKLTTLEDFRLQREIHFAEREQLKKTLADERKSFAVSFDDLENKTIMYKDKLRREAIEMLVKMSKDVHKAGKLCLTATVKSAINSNVKLQNELEVASKNNIVLRKKVEKLEDLLREKRMTIQVIEEENTVAHRKCLEYKDIVLKLIDKQLELDCKLKTFDHLEEEFKGLKQEHSLCRTDDEIGEFIAEEVDKLLERQRLLELQQKKLSPQEIEQLQKEVSRLQDIVLKLAVTIKHLAQETTEEGRGFLKDELKVLLQKTYAIALEFPDLPTEVQHLLTVRFPDVTPAIGTIEGT